MTKANQVAPLLATLRGLIPDATEAIDEFAKLAEYVDETEARAEQAEYSLAASERALAALRYQAQAGGCELSTVGENSYHCRADALCGLCRLRHRAEQAERDRDAWRAKWEALETTRAVCCDQMERERDEARAELAAWHNIARSVGFAHEPYTGPVVVDAAARGAFADWCERNKEAVDGRAAAVDRLKYERDALQAKLAEAERENLTLRNRIGIDRTSWHEAEAEVKVLRAKLAKTERERDDAMTLAEERRDYARAQNAKLSVACDDLRAQLTAVERERDEAHAALRDCATRLGNGSAVSPKASHAFHCAVATEVGIVVPALRAQLAKTERVVEAARQHLRCDLTDTESISAEHALQNALRALDSPVGGSSVDPRPLCIRCAKPWVPLEGCDATVELCPACWYRGERPGVAGTDSEGGAPCTDQVTPGTVSGGASGAATPEGGHAAPTGGPMPPPEPAGSSLEATRDPQAPATRAELEALRVRVERLEQLTGFVPKE